MDPKSQELYQEEQRKALIELRDSIRELAESIVGKIEVTAVMPKEMKVTGEVDVNTEKSVEISNLDVFLSGLKQTEEVVTKALELAKPKDQQEVVIKNIAQLIAKEVKITNIGELKASFDSLKQAIEDNQAVVNVTEKAIVWPRGAKEAIPVRLSDGKSFYNAVVSAFSGGGVSATLATDIANAIGAGGIAAYTYIQKDTTSDTVNYKYYGYMKTDGSWVIKQVNRSTNLALFEVGGSGYTAAWTARAAGTYVAYSDAF